MTTQIKGNATSTFGGNIDVTGNVVTDAPAFSADSTGGQSIASATFTKLQFNIEDFDTNNCYDHTTNYRFTPNVAGYYQVTFMVGLAGYTGNSQPALYKNGSMWISGAYPFPSAASSTSAYNVGTGLVYLNGTTDYIEAYVWTSSALTTSTNTNRARFQAFLARAV